MSARDPHRFSNQLDDSTTQRLIDRLESRAKDAVFTRLFDQYITKLHFPEAGRILEVGCGTGAMVRTLVRSENFSGKVVGVDQSAAFIEAAKRFAVAEGVGGLVEFNVGDVHDLDFEDESFEVVIAHTLISHVTDPRGVLKEIARVLQKGGALAIFDGDYASLTYASDDHQFGRRMDQALASATFNNPLIMRDLARILPETGLEITDTMANVVSEIGSASYFKSFAETYAPLVVSGDLLPKEDVDDWVAAQNAAMNDGTFFASCNYFTYLSRRI
jgi:ubiquinone/menaquinone biosynthesis C-methylase UbiE